MLFRTLLLFLGLGGLSLPTVQALNVDSLKRQIAILIDQDRPAQLMSAYGVMADNLYEQREFTESLRWYLKGLELAEEMDEKEVEFHYLNRIGSIFYYPLDDYTQALTYLTRAQRIGNGIITKEDEARNLSQIAEVYNTQGDYENALKNQLDALLIAEAASDTSNLAMGYRNMGILYWHQRQYDLALKNFRRSLRLYNRVIARYNTSNQARQALPYVYSMYTCIASMSAAYLEMNKLDTASYYIQRSKSLADSINHQYGVAYSEALAGNVSLKRKQYDKALSQLIQAVERFRRMGIKKESASFSIQIAEIYVQTDNPRKALSVLNESAKIAEDLRALFLLRDIYKTRADAHEKLGQMDQAYAYYKQHVRYKDSLLNEKRLAELAQIEHRHTVQEKNQEIASLQEQKVSSQRKLTIFGSLAGGLIFLGLLYLGYNRNRRLREFNEELGMKNEEIRMQNQRLKASNEDLRQFAHVASHDLREPLRSIGSFTTLLRRRYYDKLDEDANEFIDFISSGVNRMDMLLGDLLAYSVVGIFHTEYSETDINTIITEIIANLNREKGQVGARITIQNLPTITANRRQMVQLFTHLIDNAIKFRAASNPTIEINAQQQGNGYLFSVKDNGIGMDEAYTEKIFSIFLRLHTKKSQYGGTGIGLSICKKIVEQHRGRIWIDSHPGEGTTVFFTLPKSPLKQVNPPKSKKLPKPKVMA